MTSVTATTYFSEKLKMFWGSNVLSVTQSTGNSLSATEWEGWPHDKPFYYTDTGFTVFSQQPGSGWWKYNWLGMPKYLEGWSIFHCQLLWLSCSVHSFTFCISVSFKLCASQSAPLNPKAVPGQPFRLLYLFPTAALNSSSHNTDSS